MGKRAPNDGPLWQGTLTRTADGITGELSDPHGWVLSLSGIMVAFGNPPVAADPARMWITARVQTAGQVAPGLREWLAAEKVLAGDFERSSVDAWAGEVWGRMHTLTLEGTMTSPGRLELRGRG